MEETAVILAEWNSGKLWSKFSMKILKSLYPKIF